jgi:DNA-binding response OmpR family regulator
MGRLSYDSVDVLIYDPVPANRAATRAALYALGFRRTVNVSTVDAFVEAIQRNPPDIALCEADEGGEELCSTIQELRQGGACANPFIVIIVTSWDKSSALINRVVSSGADDLLLRPFSTAVLGSRIEAHIERRKGFVITTEYVGPDRRRDDARPGNADLFDPPNSLRMKAKEKLSDDVVVRRLEGELKQAREKLNCEKLRRDSFQICVLWRLLQEQQRPGPGASPSDLDKLIGLARTIGQRCRDTEFHPAVEWCESILAAAEGLNMGVDRNASMHLLGHAALSMHLIFHPEKTPAEQISEIDATVALIRARQHAQALAS